jgi:hypothetical protein
MDGDSGKRGRSFSMMHAVRLRNAQLASMRSSQKEYVQKEENQDGKEMLLRIASMLTRLISLFDSSSNPVVREKPPDEESVHEDEEEDEDENRTLDS